MEIEFLAIAGGLRFMPNVCELSSSMQWEISINEKKRFPKNWNRQGKNRNWPLKAIHRRKQTKQRKRQMTRYKDAKIQRYKDTQIHRYSERSCQPTYAFCALDRLMAFLRFIKAVSILAFHNLAACWKWNVWKRLIKCTTVYETPPPQKPQKQQDHLLLGLG